MPTSYNKSKAGGPGSVGEGVLPPELRGDGPSDDCGTLNNPVWFTLNVLWNEVRQAQEKVYNETFSILCPQDFIKRAAGVGIRCGWLLIPGWPYELRADSSAAEQRSYKPQVEGSTPSPPTSKPREGG